jgi:hypothetical protein
VTCRSKIILYGCEPWSLSVWKGKTWIEIQDSAEELVRSAVDDVLSCQYTASCHILVGSWGRDLRVEDAGSDETRFGLLERRERAEMEEEEEEERWRRGNACEWVQPTTLWCGVLKESGDLKDLRTNCTIVLK